MGAVRRGFSVLLAFGALSVVAAPAAHAENPPCRMNQREFRNIRVSSGDKRGMTRAFVQQLVGCGGKTVVYQEYGGGYTYRIVTYKMVTPADAVAQIVYFQDRVQSKGWSTGGVTGFPGFGFGSD